MRRRIFAALTGFVVVIALTLVSGPAHADNVAFGRAYVWADQANAPIGVPYVPSLSYQYNSGGYVNKVTHLATGRYEVRFP